MPDIADSDAVFLGNFVNLLCELLSSLFSSEQAPLDE